MRRLSPFVRSATTVLALSLLLPLSFAARKDRSEKNETPADKAEAEKWITGSIRPMYDIDELNSQYLMLSSRSRKRASTTLASRWRVLLPFGAEGIQDGYYVATWQDYTHQRRRLPEVLRQRPGQNHLRRRSGIWPAWPAKRHKPSRIRPSSSFGLKLRPGARLLPSR